MSGLHRAKLLAGSVVSLLILTCLSGSAVLAGIDAEKDGSSRMVPTKPGDSKRQFCFLYVNFDMARESLCIDVVTDSSCPYQVVYDVRVADDTTVWLTLYLPYTWPARDYRPPVCNLPSPPFHVYLISGHDSAHYHVSYHRDSAKIRLRPVAEREFIRPLPLRTFPDNLVMIQLAGNDDRLSREIVDALSQLASDTLLESGYYRGVLRAIRIVRLGVNRFNETAHGRLLVMGLRQSLTERTYGDICAILNDYRLPWFHAGPPAK
jgi:hypothetical protein